MKKSIQQSIPFEDLFSEANEVPQPTRVVEVVVQRAFVGKSQGVFKKLVHQIDEKKQILRQWQEYKVRHRQRVMDEILPLQRDIHSAQREMVLFIHDILRPEGRKPPGLRLGKVQQRKLTHVLLNLVNGLLDEVPDDQELEGIHDEYSAMSREETQTLEEKQDRLIFEELFGVDLSDYDGEGDLMHFAHQKIHQQKQADEEKRAERHQKKKAAKSAKQNSEEKPSLSKKEQEVQEASLSVKEVYRKLASTLHPDREKDPVERVRKTEIMQKVNQAYADNDLLTLLNLQLEIEQIDSDHILMLPEERLKIYIRVLRSQLGELEQEIQGELRAFLDTGPYFGALTPERIEQEFDAEVEHMKGILFQIRRDLKEFNDPIILRRWLKELLTHRNYFE
ncbi:J domain-containing protein [Ferrovum myxofaciens]|uniref:J domain-containing protein n=2 Tax=root TaxID=1 RepID=A0A9E6SXD4_9PROT|nr:J domain-containing protein [Ferrovum myxofaciens]MBU6995014.1 J domain-containing protein [Ferrovum myxofaciens]QKE38814.1 MAG: J domain-containing protein [Ferrovum myxofaciens]QKE41399.1 MAG: J domain-containing protein [Ferrovum myxofaciens]QWY74024.1 MAG: J domain-containing protein [Ferrovum myxofaciens]QWY76776.1 MAG: J domain-containing protein [Ferrovum myxofaciens]